MENEETRLINFIEQSIVDFKKIAIIEIEDYDDVVYKIKIAIENYRKSNSNE